MSRVLLCQQVQTQARLSKLSSSFVYHERHVLWVQAWCTGWWNAERQEALTQLDDILDAEAAWQPAPAPWGSASSDGLDEPSAETADDDEPRHAATIYLL